MGAIDEAALDRLSLVTELTKMVCVQRIEASTILIGPSLTCCSSSHLQHIQLRANTKSPISASELGKFAPHFIWLLRDSFLELKDEAGTDCTPDYYLDMVLRDTPGTTAAINAKNEIRKSVKSVFPERDCHTL
eukprot:1531338-Pyramimonas_sp.AAC.1